MRVCPVCARLFGEGESICPEDGVFLRAPDAPLTGQTVGSYLFMGCLGRGGMGTVYRGEHVVIGKAVALKVLHKRHLHNPQGLQRFLTEARAASMIRHPNIVDVTDYGTTPDGSPFFVMEFLEGPSLEREIERLGELPVYRAVNILTLVCRALHACHEKGIVHRDLKPENIVLQRREGLRDLVTLPTDSTQDPLVQKEVFWDDVKILDFGVARIHLVTTELDRETQRQGILFGSPYYMAPEQGTGAPGDLRVDLYAVGVIFFEMLTGQVPFDGTSIEEILLRHRQDPVPSLRATRPDLNLPAEAEGLVRRAMAKLPEDRHPSAAHLLKDLSECFGDVIYGRDIPRYLEVRRRRTEELSSLVHEHQAHFAGPAGLAADMPIARATAASPAPSGSASTPPPADAPGLLQRPQDEDHVMEELGELFHGKYEPPKPVTNTGLPRIERRRPKEPPRPDPEDVKAELAGLFDAEDE